MPKKPNVTKPTGRKRPKPTREGVKSMKEKPKMNKKNY